MSIQMDLSDTLVKEKLVNLPEKMLEYAYQVIMEQAHLMAGIWQVNINVDTGSARDSIRVERGGEGNQLRVRFREDRETTAAAQTYKQRLGIT